MPGSIVALKYPYTSNDPELRVASGVVRIELYRYLRASTLEAAAANPCFPVQFRTFIKALQAIVAGRRDRTLADDPALDYTMTAEILSLLETLEKAGK